MGNGRKGFSSGHFGLFILLLGGVWLLIAPVWVGFAHDKLASRIDEWAGAAIIVTAVASFFFQWAFGLSELVHSKKHHRDHD